MVEGTYFNSIWVENKIILTIYVLLIHVSISYRCHDSNSARIKLKLLVPPNFDIGIVDTKKEIMGPNVMTCVLIKK